MSVCRPRAPCRLARRYLKMYVTEINKNRLNTCVVACAYHVYHSVAKRLCSNPVPRAFPSRKCGGSGGAGEPEQKKLFPGSSWLLGMKVGAILFTFGGSASGRPRAPDSFSAIPGFRLGKVSHEKLCAAGVGVERLKWTWACRLKTKYPATSMKMTLTVIDFCSFPAQSTCPLEAIIMADKAESQDLKSKAKEITKVSRNHYESLK